MNFITYCTSSCCSSNILYFKIIWPIKAGATAKGHKVPCKVDTEKYKGVPIFILLKGTAQLLLESLEIARPRFQKFNSKYIESIKIARPISWLGDAYIKQSDPFIMVDRASPVAEIF